MLAGRLTLAHLSPRAEGGAGRGRRLLLSAFGSRVLSRPLRQKSFCPREFPFNTGKRSLLAFSNVPSPPGPLRAPPPRWLSPPLSSSVSLSVPRLPSGSLRPDTLPRSAPCPRRTRLSRRRSSGQLRPSTRTLPRGSLCRDVFLVSCRECPPRTPQTDLCRSPCALLGPSTLTTGRAVGAGRHRQPPLGWCSWRVGLRTRVLVPVLMGCPHWRGTCLLAKWGHALGLRSVSAQPLGPGGEGDRGVFCNGNEVARKDLRSLRLGSHAYD